MTALIPKPGIYQVPDIMIGLEHVGAIFRQHRERPPANPEVVAFLDDLDALAEEGRAIGEAHLKEGGDFASPVLRFASKSGVLQTLVMPHIDTADGPACAALAYRCGQICQHDGADAFLVICEAWLATYHEDDPDDVWATAPADHPERREALIITAGIRARATRQLWHIHRGPDQRFARLERGRSKVGLRHPLLVDFFRIDLERVAAFARSTFISNPSEARH